MCLRCGHTSSSCYQGMWPLWEPPLLHGAFVDPHDGIKKSQRLRLLPLEGVAADDRAEPPTIADRAHFGEDLLIAGSRSTRENDDATPGKGALDNVAYAVCQRRYGDLVLLVGLLRLWQFYPGTGQLDLDDICPQLGGNLGSVSNHVNGGLAFFGEAAATGIRPDDDGQTSSFRLIRKFS